MMDAKLRAQVEAQSDQNNAQAKAQQEERKEQLMEQKRIMLRSALDADAFERLHRIELVKPEKAQAIADLILQQATRGYIQQKLTDAQFVEILEKVSSQGAKTSGSSIVTIRRKRMDDSDDDLPI
eukprot:Filipodium_phascolosomae@DN2307_c0_g1_i1.p1